MKINYFLFLLLWVQVSNCQIEKIISGKVVNENFAMAKVDVINMTQKTVVTTNNDGEFKIKVAVGDKLVLFVNEFNNYKIIITQKDLDANNLQLNLSKLPIELDEVLISNKFTRAPIVTQEDIDKITLDKQAAAPKVIGAYDGQITNGADFIRMGKGLAKFVKGIFGSDEKDVKAEVIPFKNYLENTFDNKFYTDSLKLKSEDITVFKEYCELDKQATVLMKDVDELRIYEFLIAKSDAFKKMRNY